MQYLKGWQDYMVLGHRLKKMRYFTNGNLTKLCADLKAHQISIFTWEQKNAVGTYAYF